MNIDWDSHIRSAVADFNRRLLAPTTPPGYAEGGTTVQQPIGLPVASMPVVSPGWSAAEANRSNEEYKARFGGESDRTFQGGNTFALNDTTVNARGIPRQTLYTNDATTGSVNDTWTAPLKRRQFGLNGFAEGGAPEGIIPGPVTPGGGDNTETPTQTGEYITPVDAIIAKGRELAPKIELSDQDAHALGKLWFDQETTRLKQEAGNNTPPKNAGVPVKPGQGMAEGGMVDKIKKLIGLPPTPPTIQNPLDPIKKALGHAEGGMVDYEKKNPFEPDPTFGISTGAPDIGKALAAPAMPGYVAPVVTPNYNNVGIPNAQGIGGTIQSPADTRPFYTGSNELGAPITDAQDTALRTEWAKEPVNLAEAARVAGLPKGVPSYMPVTSDKPGGARTIQVVQPDATGIMPAVTMPNGGYIEPGLAPADFGRRAGEENALFGQALYDKQGNVTGPDTQGIAKEVNERTKRENELEKLDALERIAGIKADAAASLESEREKGKDARLDKRLDAQAERTAKQSEKEKTPQLYQITKPDGRGINIDASTPEGRKRMKSALKSGERIERLTREDTGSTSTTVKTDTGSTTTRVKGVAKGNAAVSIPPGTPSATNPQTGAKVYFINGKWQ